MKNFTFSKAGRDWNEDRCFSCNDFAFVLDGATSVYNQKFSSCTTDAEWYSQWWFEFLKKNLNNYSKTLPEILQSGIEQVVKDFKLLAKDETILDFPSATVSIVRKNGDKIEVYTLADSPIILQSDSMSIMISDTLNNVNDDIHKMIIKDIAQKNNMSIIEAKTKYPDCIRQGRDMKNTFGGSFVLADDKQAILHGVYKIIDANLIKKAILLTDGFSQIFDLFKKYTIDEFANKINNIKDVEKLYLELFNLQEKDSYCNEFIRFKKRDDASIAVLIFD